MQNFCHVSCGRCRGELRAVVWGGSTACGLSMLLEASNHGASKRMVHCCRERQRWQAKPSQANASG